MDFVLIPIVPLLTKHLKLDNYTPCGTNNSAKFCIINERNNIRRVIFFTESDFMRGQVDALRLGEVVKTVTQFVPCLWNWGVCGGRHEFQPLWGGRDMGRRLRGGATALTRKSPKEG